LIFSTPRAKVTYRAQLTRGKASWLVVSRITDAISYAVTGGSDCFSIGANGADCDIYTRIRIFRAGGALVYRILVVSSQAKIVDRSCWGIRVTWNITANETVVPQISFRVLIISIYKTSCALSYAGNICKGTRGTRKAVGTSCWAIITWSTHTLRYRS
jgi:hypothetical protein